MKLLATSAGHRELLRLPLDGFAYGRSLGAAATPATKQSVQTAFKGAGYNVKQLLLALTQTDGFLYRAAQ